LLLVDAVRAIVREYARPDLLDTAAALTKRLREVTNDFLREQNSFGRLIWRTSSRRRWCRAADRVF